jgi:hypothetical protein
MQYKPYHQTALYIKNTTPTTLYQDSKKLKKPYGSLVMDLKSTSAAKILFTATLLQTNGYFGVLYRYEKS